MDYMPSINSTHTSTTNTPLPPPVDAASALALLHNHPAFQSLQPLLVKNITIPVPATPATSWLVAEAQSLAQANGNTSVEYREVSVAVPMGPFTNTVVTTSAFVDTEDGLIIVFQAPLGLHGVNRFRVLREAEGEGGGLVLSEEARLIGFRLMMPFVVKTEQESHGEAGRAFGRKLVEMKGEEGEGEGEIAGK